MTAFDPPPTLLPVAELLKSPQTSPPAPLPAVVAVLVVVGEVGFIVAEDPPPHTSAELKIPEEVEVGVGAVAAHGLLPDGGAAPSPLVVTTGFDAVPKALEPNWLEVAG